VESPGAGGGAGVIATTSGGEARLGQAVERRVPAGKSHRKVVKRRGRGWATCGRAQSGAGVAGAAHMAGTVAAARGREAEERGREVDEEGPGCNFQKR
jgi:hypothetical protein